MELKVANHIWEKDEKGGWKWKPDPQFHTKLGVLKPKYQDLPAYPAIYQIEDQYQNNFNEMIKATSKLLIRRLTTVGQQKLK